MFRGLSLLVLLVCLVGYFAVQGMKVEVPRLLRAGCDGARSAVGLSR